MSAQPAQFDDLPAAMREARRWLVWRSMPNADPAKKPRKVPFYVSGDARNGALDTEQDRAQLVTFAEALAVLPRYSGLGFALGPDGTGNCWQGVDLDSLNTRPALALLADDGLPGYTETSPSGNGLHAIGYGRPFAPLGANSSGIEAYSSGRYFTVTADNAGLGEPVDLHDFVRDTLAPRHSQHAPPVDATVAEIVPPQTLAELRSALASMRSDDRELWVANGQRLKRLGEQGRALWIEWSQQSDKFDPADAARVWDSFTADRTGHQAIFAEAQRRGWLNPLSASAPTTPTQPPPDSLANALDAACVPFTDDERARSAIPHPHAFMDLQGRRGLLPMGEVTVMAAPGREGKTTMVAAIAKHYALGWPLADMAPVQIGSVMVYSAEDDREQYCRKLEAQHGDLTPADGKLLQGNILVPDLNADALVAWRKVVKLEARQPIRGPIVDQLVAVIRKRRTGEFPLGLVIFETASTLSEAEEDNVGLSLLVDVLKYIAKATGVAVLLTHHTSQESAKSLPTLELSEAAFRGGTALVNNARQTLLAVNLGSAHDPFPDADARTLLRRMVAPGEMARVTMLTPLSTSKLGDPCPLFFRWADTEHYGPRGVEIQTLPPVAGKSWRGVYKLLAGARADAAADRKADKEQANVRLVIRAVGDLSAAGEQPTVRKVSAKCGYGADWAKSRLAAGVELGELVRSTEQVPRAKGMTDVYRLAGAESPWRDDSSANSSAPWMNPTGDAK